MATEAVQTDQVYSQIESYDWNNDSEFQAGLQAILGSAPSPEQVEHLTMRARCFYFSRKFHTKVDFDGYQAWRVQQTRGALLNGTSTTASSSEQIQESNTPAETNGEREASADLMASPGPHGDAPTPASFAEICQLIAEGKPVPGIKDIPDTILEGQATRSVVNKRRKPWEKDAAIVTDSTVSTMD